VLAAETMFLRIKSQAQKRKKTGNWFVAFTLLFPVHALWLLDEAYLSFKTEFNVLQFGMTLFCSSFQIWCRWHMTTKIAWSNCLQIVSYCQRVIWQQLVNYINVVTCTLPVNIFE
jgi:hypothetical protein